MTVIYEGAISSQAIGGARLHFRGMARALDRARLGRLVIVLPRFHGEPTFDAGVGERARVIGIRCPRRSLFGHLVYEVFKTVLIGALRVTDVLRRRRTVHMMRISPIGVSPIVSRVLRATVVVEVNGLPDGEFESRGFSKLIVRGVRTITGIQLRCATHVVAVTAGLARACGERTDARILRLENAVDLDDLASMINRSGEGAPHTITYSGAFAPWQELELLVDAFAQLVVRDPTNPWRLVLIGDGEERARIEAAIDRCGVADRVAITGWVDRDTAAERVLDGAVAVVPLTPKTDSGICGSPLKLFEYLALGRRVVGSDVDGIVELEDYPVTVYDHGDVESLVGALESAVSSGHLTATSTGLMDMLSWDDRSRRLLVFLGLGSGHV